MLPGPLTPAGCCRWRPFRRHPQRVCGPAASPDYQLALGPASDHPSSVAMRDSWPTEVPPACHSPSLPTASIPPTVLAYTRASSLTRLPAGTPSGDRPSPAAIRVYWPSDLACRGCPRNCFRVARPASRPCTRSIPRFLVADCRRRPFRLQSLLLRGPPTASGYRLAPQAASACAPPRYGSVGHQNLRPADVPSPSPSRPASVPASARGPAHGPLPSTADGGHSILSSGISWASRPIPPTDLHSWRQPPELRRDTSPSALGSFGPQPTRLLL